MSDEIWADARSEPAVPAADKTTDVLHVISSIQRSLREIDKQPTARDLVTQVVAWLRALPPGAGATEALAALAQQHTQWTSDSYVVSDALWFHVAEIAALLAIHGHPACLRAFQTTALRPTSMPRKEAFCDRQGQMRFTNVLFNALCGPAATRHSPDTAPLVIEVFVAWMVRVMGDYELIFLHHIAQPLAAHIQQTHRVLPDSLAHAAQGFVNSRITETLQRTTASSVAVASILLSASSQSAAIRSLQTLAVQKLQSKDVFPHVHDSVAIVAVALQVAPLAVVSSPLIHQFILLRVVHLALVSPRLLINRDDCKRLSERYQEALYRSHLGDSEVDACLRTMDAATSEIQAAIDASPAICTVVLQTMRSGSDQEIFRPSLIARQEERGRSLANGSETEAFPAQPFLASYYDAVAISIQALSQSPSSHVVVHCFGVLCRLEFARECCATPQRNATMARLTLQVEELIESAPDATLSTIAAAVIPPSPPQEDDIVVGWACLAVGLIVQRKLRVVLFQASDATRRDSFAVVFAGLYHGLEPVNAFAHRFIGFALASLGQFVSVYEIFPFYLQETLRRFPSDVPRPQAASALGTVFGALYYTPASQASTEQEKLVEATATETRHAMVLWALRQTSQRTKALLDGDAAVDGLYLAELFFEVAKMAPVELLPAVAREMEALVHHSSGINEAILHAVQMRVFNAVSLNCEAEKRAWFAAWFLELSAVYPLSPMPKVVDEQAAVDDAVNSSASTAPPPQTVSRL
jgi:hypothetical protein